MAELREFLAALPEPVLWLLAGAVTEALLQVAKRWWRPLQTYEAKAQKLCAAALVSLALAVVANCAGVGEFAAAWVMGFVSAVGWHEVKDKSRRPLSDLIADLLERR